jgi:5-formyltetrahydrofolate cyclo-ligase
MKQTLKQQIIEKRNSLKEEEIIRKSNKIKNNLFSLQEFQKAENILFYVSFNKEVNTQEIIKGLLKEKEKNIIVPFTIKNDLRLHLSELKDFVELEPKTFGILEPKEKYIREFNKDKLDLVIVPGIVFDKKGHRIGYGYGYYDRFLKTIKKEIVKIGLAFDFQLIEKIPEEKHDVPLNIIVTENEIIKVN